MPKLSNSLVILPYDPNWKNEFERIRNYLMEHIGDLVLNIRHMGSTSVPGLAAKPIIDIIAVIESYDVFPEIVVRLSRIGFIHQGDQGINEREAFKRNIADDFMEYHFYVCPKTSEELKRQMLFIEYLRSNKETADKYGELKRNLIDEVKGDRVLYTESKTEFIFNILNKAHIMGNIDEAELDYSEYPIDMKNPWYHGTPLEIEILKEGSTVTQWKELAEAFATKPTMLGYDKIYGEIKHNGSEIGRLYIINEPIRLEDDIYQHPRTTMDKGVEFLTKRPLRLKQIL